VRCSIERTLQRGSCLAAPDLVKAAIEGRLPHGIGVARLFDAPVAWARQRQMLGQAR
jgi:site-specific DNA recombinase